jgi:hypothetical protein
LRRDFQDATFFLGFLQKASKSKFKATAEAIEWPRIARAIGDAWANLPHEAEILLTVGLSSEKVRTQITEMVAQNLDRIEKFSPRLAIMMPELAIRHIEAGKRVRLGQHHHFEFQFGAILIAQLAQLRPDLVEPVLAPFEPLAGKVLSGENASWFQRAAFFVDVLREAAPVSLDRILSSIDVAKAESGWIDALQKPSAAQDTVALLVESALSRQDAVGDMARRLRKKYRSQSVPKKRKRRPVIGMTDPRFTPRRFEFRGLNPRHHALFSPPSKVSLVKNRVDSALRLSPSRSAPARFALARSARLRFAPRGQRSALARPPEGRTYKVSPGARLLPNAHRQEIFAVLLPYVDGASQAIVP